MRAALALAMLLGGCGDGTAVTDRGASENQMERLSTPRKDVVDLQAAARLRPLAPSDLARAGLSDPICDFSRDGGMLFAVSAADAIAKVGGTVRHFAHSTPAEPTGGFFEDRQVSVSVGRVGEVPPGGGAAGSWPARITVTNRRAEARTELNGIWRCRG